MALDLRSATLLVTCAREGSLGRAAEALALTQPALSRLLRRVERDLGAPLFERTTRGVVPTVYGAAVLPHAELILAESAKAAEVVAALRGASRGVVRVGGVASVVGSLIVSAIAEVRRERPELRFQIVEGLEDALLEDLKRGAIDLAVSPAVHADEMVALAIPETPTDRVAVYARAEHPVFRGPAPDLAAVAAMDWALPPADTPITQEWARRLLAAGVEPRPAVISTRSVQAVRAAVLAADLLCWMPAPLLAPEVAAGLLRRLELPALDWTRSFRVYRRRRSLLTPAAELLLRALRRVGSPGTPPA